MMCTLLWLEMVMLVAWEKEGLRIVEWFGRGLSLLRTSSPSKVSRDSSRSLVMSSFSSSVAGSGAGERGSVGVGANEDALEVSFDAKPGTWRRCFEASSAASFREMADAFLRGKPDLKANFWRGANVVWIFWNLSVRALMACFQRLVNLVNDVRSADLHRCMCVGRTQEDSLQHL